MAKHERENIETPIDVFLGLTIEENKIVCDHWLADADVDVVIGAMYRDTMDIWPPSKQHQKAVAIRNRYIMLDSAKISRDLDEKFGLNIRDTEDEGED